MAQSAQEAFACFLKSQTLLTVGLTRTRAPTATPEDDRGEKAEPRRYALLTLIRNCVGGTFLEVDLRRAGVGLRVSVCVRDKIEIVKSAMRKPQRKPQAGTRPR
jgi:hypothetical protein